MIKKTKTNESKVNHKLLQFVYLAMRSNARKQLASTKTRGMVNGTNAKPWKQKGTGRARHGSRKTPIWRGGGVTFGPNNRLYKQTITSKVMNNASNELLKLFKQEKKIIEIDSIPKFEKTKKANEWLIKTAGLDEIGLMLGDARQGQKSFNNISNLTILYKNSLDLLKLSNCQKLIIIKEKREN